MNKIFRLTNKIILLGYLLTFNISFTQSLNNNYKDGINVKQRFVDSKSGILENCIIDNATGLMWSKNTTIGFIEDHGENPSSQPKYMNNRPILNEMNWINALEAIKKMNNSPNKLCGYNDWRLPNKYEIKQLAVGIKTNENNFINIKDQTYWSSSTYHNEINDAWYVYLKDGRTSLGAKKTYLNVLPVRGP